MADTDIEKQPEATATPMDFTTTSTVVATKPPMEDQEKQGAKCCGCCCDYRRAVIVVNILFIIFGVLSFIGSVATAAIAGNAEFDDDVLRDNFDDDVKRSATVNSILGAISIVIAIVAIVGAVKFNIYMVGTGLFWLVVQYILSVILTIRARNQLQEDYPGYNAGSLVLYFVISAIFTLWFIYPHDGFIHEVRAGIMTQETYPREEYSCCCTSHRG